MSIGTLTVNVAANTPRANKALQTTASMIRLVGGSGAEAVGGLKVATSVLKTLGSPGVAGAASKSLRLVANTISAIDKAGTVVSSAKGALPRIAFQLGRIAAMGGGAGAAVAGVGAVAVVGGLIRAQHALRGIAEYSERVMDLQRGADRLGTSTRFSGGLRLAAESVGVGGDLALTSLEKFNVRISEAARGEGEAVKVLKELGVNAQSLLAAPPEQRFSEIAAAMSQITNEADKLRIAGKLFEEEGRSMVQVLALGVQQLREFNNEAERLGIAPTAEESEAVRDYLRVLREAHDEWRAVDDTIRRNFIDYKKFGPQMSAWAARGTQAAMNVGYGVMSSPSWVKDIPMDLIRHYGGEEKFRFGRKPLGPEGLGLTVEQKLQQIDMYGRGVQSITKPLGRGLNTATLGLGAGLDSLFAGYGGMFHKRMPRINGMLALQQLQGVGSGARSLGRWLGAGLNTATLGLSSMGLGGAASQDIVKGPAYDRINSLVDAGGSEGYMALRANQRTARLNPADKSAPKIEKATQKSADTLVQMFDWLKKGPAPRRI